MRLIGILVCMIMLIGGSSAYVVPAPVQKMHPGHDYIDTAAQLEALYDSPSFFKDYVDYIDALVARYADTGIVGMTSIGKSVKGRDIYNISVGNKDGGTKITINATHHSNEYINTILVLNQIERVLQMHRDNEEYNGLSVRQLLSKAQIHLIPLVNPDGLEAYIKYIRTGVLEEGFSKSGIHRFNANNVNLNRNYDAKFRANVQNSGSYPFSEPETQALRELHNQMAFDYSLAYHSEGNVMFWNFGQTGEFYDQTLAVARMLGEQTGYALDMLPAAKSRYIGGIADFGGYKDWLVTNGYAASTVETSSGSMTRTGKVAWSAYEDIWARNMNVPLALVHRFYIEKNRLFEYDLVTANLSIDGRLYPNELILYDGSSYINKPLFEVLQCGGDTDGIVRSNQGKRAVIDVTNSDRYIMLDSARYHLLRAIVDNDAHILFWDGNTRTVHVNSKGHLSPGIRSR